ncbi:MAG: hypothetical protein QM652_00935 [Legionella sp.]|uniref:hypothetical protein n=1 Tax=Legionella sp. TaxID=459 RepID=UPI0039E683D3
MNTWINWPGEIPHYFDFTKNKVHVHTADVWTFLASFWHWSLLTIPSCFLMAFKTKNKTLIKLPLLILAVILPATLIYAFRGLDILVYKYPLFWATAFYAAAAAISTVILISKINHKTIQVILFSTASLWAIYSIQHFSFRSLEIGINGKELKQAVNSIKKLTQPSQYVWINLEKNNVLPVVLTTTLISIDRRSGQQSFCIMPKSWDIAYSFLYKCGPKKKPIASRIKIQAQQSDKNDALFSANGIDGKIQLPINSPMKS